MLQRACRATKSSDDQTVHDRLPKRRLRLYLRIHPKTIKILPRLQKTSSPLLIRRLFNAGKKIRSGSRIPRKMHGNH